MFTKIFTIIGVVAASTLAYEIDLSQKVNETIENYQQAVQNVRELEQEFGGLVVDTVGELQQNKRDYKRTLLSILQETEQEVQANYLKVVQPVAQEYAEYLKTLKVNENCNENCVVE